MKFILEVSSFLLLSSLMIGFFNSSIVIAIYFLNYFILYIFRILLIIVTLMFLFIFLYIYIDFFVLT